MSNCIFIEDSPQGDTRTFKIGEPVCLRDGHFTEGTYQGPLRNPNNGLIYGHKITSEIYPKREVSFRYVGKKLLPVSKTALNVVFKNKVGDPYFAKHFSTLGYGGKRKTRKHKQTRT